MPNSLRTVVIIIVAAVWAINFTAPVFIKDYKPTPELNVAFMAILGVLTASYTRDTKNKGKPDGQDKTSTDENEQDDEHGQG